MSAAPIRIGLLFDFPQHDGGDSFATAVDLGLSTVALDRPVELVRALAAGLPAGTALDVEQKFASLEQQGVLAIVGPSISDNGLVVRDLADARGAAVHQLHGRRDHAQRAHVPLPGRLARRRAGRPRRHLAKSRGIDRVAVVHDRSPVGRTTPTGSSWRAPPLGSKSRPAAPSPRSPKKPRSWSTAWPRRSPTASSTWASGWRPAPLLSPSTVSAGTCPSWPTPRSCSATPGRTGAAVVGRLGVRRHGERRQRATRSTPGAEPAHGGRPAGRRRVRHRPHPRRGDPPDRPPDQSGGREGLERVKRLPASSGHDGTTMGFGRWDHGALKGPYLVLREWRDGASVEVA